MAWDDDLEGTARDIASTDARRLRVMAGPGTGKSFAIKRRVARLLEEGHDPRRILVVTFTRTAAKSLVDDLMGMGTPGCDDLQVSTLHSYCFGLLNREDVFEFLHRTPRPLVTFDKSKSMQFEGAMLTNDLAAADRRFSKKRDSTERIRAFEAAWARLQHEDPGRASDPLDQVFEDHLLSWLRFHRAMLIGELVPEVLRFLRSNPASRPVSAFDHVIVDEYQDLNRAEQEIVDLLAHHGNTSIVGDVDQSIYSFRHANPDGIHDYGQRHPTTHDEALELCRRCPTRVVTVADHLIKHNYDAESPPRLLPTLGNRPGDIHLVQWEHPTAEARGLATYVADLLENSRCRPSDVLILTPRRKLAYQLRDLLLQADIPVHSSYREEALEEESAQRAFALLTLLNDQEDRVALRWWLGHRSSIGLRGSYRRLRDHCEETDLSPWRALAQMCDGALVIKGTEPLRKPFEELRTILQRLRSLTLTECVAELFPDDDEGCFILRDAANLVVEDCNEISEIFDHLNTFLVQPEAPEGDFVRIMSLQKAKGLTSQVVIITGCIHGLIPTLDDDLTDAEREAAIQEQRRLFYVAVTRCTDTLVISSVARMQPKLAYSIGAKLAGVTGGYGRAFTSQYVGELGPDAPAMMRGEQWRDNGFATG